ncbi:uncharacterized protein [Miscanthus floridulus]|uniref:uncharacterized protein n=1 Tax=Miscanthus floridulus TaxID=154761 RepID=UPI00345AD4EE
MDSSSRRPLCDVLGIGDDDLEEGEYVPGEYQSSSNTDDDDRFDHQSSRREDDEVHPQHGGRMRRLEDIVAVGRVGAGAPLPASPTPSSESEGTISDHRSASSAGGVGTRPALKFACHVCGKGFSSRKAVDGHMRVHGSGSRSGRHVVATAAAAFSGGWAATGRRGSTGGKGKPSAAAASLNSESTTGHSTAIVAVQVQQPLEPVPMAFAVTNLSPMPSSTRTNLSGEDDEGSSATATAQPVHYDEPVVVAAAVVTGANPSSTGARAAGPVNHQLAAAADQQAPAPQVHRQAVSVPPPAAQEAQFAQQPLPPPAGAVQLQQGGQLVPRPAQPPREYSCKVCGKTYSTHQGLGGHAAGHRNRQREQEAMAAAAGMMMMPHGGGGEFLAALRRGRKAEEPHACQKCHKVFATGVALGGHMRMHYTGPPIVHKSKKRCVALVAAVQQPPPPAVSEADLRLALSTAKTEEPSSSPAPAVAGTSRLRLFGIDIGPLGQQQAPSEQQGSGTTEGSSSAGEQQQHK